MTITKISPKVEFLNKWKPRLKIWFKHKEFENDLSDLVHWVFEYTWRECEKSTSETNALKFAFWIQNNFYKPYGLPNNWILEKSPADLLSDDNIFTTEELYDIFLKNKNETNNT